MAETKKPVASKQASSKPAAAPKAAPKTTTSKPQAKPVAKTAEKSAPKATKVVEDTLYIEEVSSSTRHQLQKATASWNEGQVEYVYKGKLAKGVVRFLTGKNLSTTVPSTSGEDHGYTLEGKAQQLFEVSKALNVQNEWEGRSFNYINEKSTLKFVGDPKAEVSLYVRVYQNESDNRWVVIYAE